MSLFPHMLGHHDTPKAANDNFKENLHQDTIAVLDDTTNDFYEIMSNSEDLQELRMEVAA